MKFLAQVTWIGIIIFFSLSSPALIDRSVVIEGKVKSFDDHQALIEVRQSIVRVPSLLVKSHKFQAGQFVTLRVDIADLIELNKDLLAKNGIK